MILRRIYDGPEWDFRNPLEEMQRMKRRMETLFESLSSAPWREGAAGVFPLVNVTEDKDKFYLRAELPGVKAQDLTIDLHENILTLSGGVHAHEGQEEVDVIREYRTGKYYRQFNLSEVIDQAKIGAELKDGVLRLKLPKVEPAKPRKITVKAS